MTLIKTTSAVGHVLCHDITQIVPGEYKDARFRKGHIVTPEDIPVLLSMGKEYLYIWEKKSGMLHEEEAAEILCGLAQGVNIKKGDVKEGKIELFAECDGLLKVRSHTLFSVNSLDGVIVATRRGNESIKKGAKVAGLKVVPLIIEESILEKARSVCSADLGHDKKLLDLLPFSHKRVGLIVTGNEVYHKRIPDKFSPVIIEKLSAYDAEIVDTVILDDDHKRITEACLNMIEKQCDLVICTGGMSVDPDDKTPLAIKNTGAEIISYGAPVLPGGMTLLSYYHKDSHKIPVIGIPACVMYYKKTIFDILLARVMADDEISKDELAMLGEGGLL